MRFLPFDKYTIATTKTTEEIMNLLKYNTSEGQIFRFFKNHKKFFNGHIYYNGFRIGKSIDGGNSCLPIILGEIIDNGNERLINIRIRMTVYANVFMVIWLLGVTFFLNLFVYLMVETGTFIPQALIIILFYVVAFVLIKVGYKIPSKSCKSKLEEIIEE